MASAGAVRVGCVAVLALGLAACRPQAPAVVPAPGAEPALAALVTHEEERVGVDGVTHRTRYQERLVRAEGRVWVERVLDPRLARRAHGEEEAAAGHRHDHDWSVVPRLVQRTPGGVGLHLVLRAERELVEVPRVEFDSVGFSTDWAESASLFPRELLGQLQPGSRPGAPEGARWLERKAAGSTLRVLWSDALALALQVESGRDDGVVVRRMTVQLEALPSTLPWAGSEAFALRDITDFRD